MQNDRRTTRCAHIEHVLDPAGMGSVSNIFGPVCGGVEVVAAQYTVRLVCLQCFHFSNSCCGVYRELFQTLQIVGTINVLLFRVAPLGGEVFFFVAYSRQSFNAATAQATLGAAVALENVQGEFQFHHVSTLRQIFQPF